MNTVAHRIAARFLPVAPPQPAVAAAVAPRAGAVANASAEVAQLLARLLREESALYAITRGWRYDTAGRKFLRLHAVLDEQFSEIGRRLARLAARCRDLAARNSAGHGEPAPTLRDPASGGGLEAHMIRELLALHETMSGHLRSASNATRDRFHDLITTELLADLAMNHEKDAFMLRALLWEVENNPR